MNNIMKKEFFEKLYKASKAAFEKLLAINERFYYCTLTITGDGLTPVISAWSYEALERECGDDEEVKYDIEWSYADSPYYAWEYESFHEVEELLENCSSIDDLSEEEWEKEIDARIDIMEKVMRKLDEEGVFSKNQERNNMVVLAEIMPPDESNTKRAYRLNSIKNEMFQKWLKEVAE